ncbi:hypothetical protein ACJX0J_026148, partial [Zea mays]
PLQEQIYTYASSFIPNTFTLAIYPVHVSFRKKDLLPMIIVAHSIGLASSYDRFLSKRDLAMFKEYREMNQAKAKNGMFRTNMMQRRNETFIDTSNQYRQTVLLILVEEFISEIFININRGLETNDVQAHYPIRTNATRD